MKILIRDDNHDNTIVVHGNSVKSAAVEYEVEQASHRTEYILSLSDRIQEEVKLGNVCTIEDTTAYEDWRDFAQRILTCEYWDSHKEKATALRKLLQLLEDRDMLGDD